MQLAKVDLIRDISQRLGVSQREVEEVLSTYSQVATEYMADSVEVPIPGVGKLTLQHRPSRPARNPRTGETVMTRAKSVPKLKASRGFEHAINS